MHHDLKTWPEFYSAVRDLTKPFELREDNRPFNVGDTLCLREWNPDEERYTGNSVSRSITFVLRDAEEFGLKKGYCILGLR